MKRKTIFIALIFLLIQTGMNAQTECQLKITWSMNKTNPPSYNFSSDYEGDSARFYWHISDEAVYNVPAPTHTFKTSGNHKVILKVAARDGSVCYGKISGYFEGTDSISTQPGIFQAKGRVKDISSISGCKLVISTENGQLLLPVEMLPKFDLQPGQYIEFAYEYLEDIYTICMTGKPVRIHRIAEITPPPAQYITARGKVVDMSELAGCDLVIKMDTGTTVIPAEIVQNFILKAGQYVMFTYEVLDRASACNMGPVVRIHRIEEISFTTPECKVEPVYKVVDATKFAYKFFARSSSPVEIWDWQFGDGSFSNEAEPEHQYEKAGIYEVTCTVLTESGCKISGRVLLYAEAPGLPVCPGGITLTLFDPSEKGCDGKAIVALFDQNGTEYKDVIYRWSTGDTGNTASDLCANKPYFIHAQIKDVCQKNTSFTFLSKPTWRVSNSGDLYTFEVENPVEGATYTWKFEDGVEADGEKVSFRFDKEGTYNVNLTVSFGSVVAATDQKVNVSGLTTGLEVTTKQEFKVYPNPATEKFYIETGNISSDLISLEIFDIQGRILMNRKVEISGKERTEVDIRILPSGLYLIRLISPDHSWPLTRLLVRN